MKCIRIKLFLFTCLLTCAMSCQRELLENLYETDVVLTAGNLDHPFASKGQAIINNYIAKGLPGVSIVIESPNGGIWRSAAGFAKLETKTPMATHHVFNSGSVAKTYHVVAALKLYEEGVFDIDRTIDTYLPDWICKDLANRSTATVRQLMNHSSGIPDYIEDTDHILDYFNNLRKEFTQEEFINYVCGQEANFVPGARASYSNTNTVLLALIMDKLVGDHADVVTQKIITELKLNQTFYKNEPGYPVPAGGVNTYVDLHSNGILINSTDIQRHFDKVTIGHDGMLASANDYYLFIKAVFEGGLISDRSLEQMKDFVAYQNYPRYGEGLGIQVILSQSDRGRKMGHDGSSFGAANSVNYYEDIDSYLIVCSNFGNFFDGPLSELYAQMVRELEALIFEG